MNIESYYKEEFIKDISAKFLLGGQIPSAQLVKSKVDELIASTYKNLGTQSLTSQASLFLEPRGELSLEDYLRLCLSLNIDINLLRSLIMKNYEELISIESSSLKEFERTEKELKNLNDKLDYELLADPNSEGYLAFFKEFFTNMDYVDTANSSNVEVLCSKGLVKLAPIRSDISTKINLDLENISVSFSGSVGLYSTVLTSIGGTDIRNILKSSSNGWMVNAYSDSPGQATCTVELNFGNGIELNRLELSKLASDSDGTIECFLMNETGAYSRFGDIRSLTESIVFTGAEQKAIKIKLLMKKNLYEVHVPGRGYYYTFNIKELLLYKETNLYTEGTFESTELTIGTSSSSDIRGSFNKAALEACDVNTADTEVNYYVSLNSASWIPIQPINKEPSSIAYIVSQDTDIYVDNMLGGESLVEGSSLLLGYDTEDIVYNLPNPNTSFINFSLDSGSRLDSIKVIANIETSPLSGTQNCWILDSGYYKCVFLVEDLETYISLGPSTVLLNNILVSGLQKLVKGWHSIGIESSRFSMIAALATNEDSLRSRDPLYPYNVKCLIEGYQYAEGYVGKKPYIGFKLRGSRNLVYTMNISSIDKEHFYVGLQPTSSSRLVYVSRPEDTSLISSSKYYVSYNRSVDKIETIKLKAVLKTRNKTLSPLIQSYAFKFI